MNRFDKVFKSREKVFVAYLTAGHKGIEYSFESAIAMIEGGVNILEIGVPFSDPIADGPVIQKAMQEALERKTSIDDVFSLVGKIRNYDKDIPIVLFSYLNPILKIGRDFYTKASKAGADGILIVDMPLEESKKIHQKCKDSALELIFIISPSTPKKRIKEITKHAGGFLYYVCRKGTTGMKSQLPEDFAEKIKEIKSSSKLPVVAGFGISSKSMADEVIQYADGFVVGSYLVEAMQKGIGKDELTSITRNLGS